MSDDERKELEHLRAATKHAMEASAQMLAMVKALIACELNNEREHSLRYALLDSIADYTRVDIIGALKGDFNYD